MTPHSTATNLDEFVDQNEFVNRYPGLFSLSQLKWVIKMRHYNGFDIATRKIGKRKMIIHIPTALDWIDSQKS